MEIENKIIFGGVVGAIAFPLLLKFIVKDISKGGLFLAIPIGGLFGLQGAIILDRMQKNKLQPKEPIKSNADGGSCGCNISNENSGSSQRTFRQKNIR